MEVCVCGVFSSRQRDALNLVPTLKVMKKPENVLLKVSFHSGVV